MLRVNNGCWINVEERFPEDGVFVFVTDGKTVDVGYYLSEDDEWLVNFDALDPDSIEAWLPWPTDPNDFYVFSVPEKQNLLDDNKPSPEQISSLREEVEKELREQLAKEQSKETAKQNPALVELNVRFEQLQRVLADLSVSVSRLDEADRVKFAGLITKTVNDQLVLCFGG